MKNTEQRNLEKRLQKLEQDSHPPVNWKELIYANIERIDQLESDNERLIDIIMSLTDEKRDLKKRLSVMEEILHSYIPIV
jgi:Trp operon repressor